MGKVLEPIVPRLRKLVAGLSGLGDARAHRDPTRRGFYFLKDELLVFYVAVTPVTGRILLLASWPREAAMPLECAAD